MTSAFTADDAGNGERLAHHYGDQLRYVHGRNRWYVWAGNRWTEDDTGHVDRCAKHTARAIFAEAAEEADAGRDKLAEQLGKHAARSVKHASLRAMVSRGGTEPPIPVRPHDFDADPWMLNTPGGTVDLRRGKLLPHRREDLLTKLAGGTVTDDLLASEDPYPACPTFERFLQQVLPDDEVRTFLQRLVGQTLVGEVREHVLPVLWGDGANGKSTLVGALHQALGDYCQMAPASLLVATGGHDGPTPELLRLRGARLVVASETDSSARLDEAQVKQLTGGDRLVARMPYGRDFEEWDPTHSVLLVTNHKPVVRGTDTGIWRRLLLIPFDQTIPADQRDADLPAKLAAEADGILAWAIHGARQWHADGLNPPGRVSVATEVYRAEMDVIGAWMADCCVQVHGASAGSTDLHRSYANWCRDNGEGELSQKRFGPELERRGFTKDRDPASGRVVYRGLGLAARTVI